VDLSVWIKQLFKQTCYVYNSLGNSSHSANANTSTIRYVCCYNTLLQPNQFNSLHWPWRLQRPDKFEPLSNNSNISEMMSPMTQCRGRRKSTTKLISIAEKHPVIWHIDKWQHVNTDRLVTSNKYLRELSMGGSRRMEGAAAPCALAFAPSCPQAKF